MTLPKKLPAVIDDNNIQEISAAAKKYAELALSQNTRKGYLADWSDFEYWCKRSNLTSLPATAETVTLYLTKMSNHLKTSSIRRRITSIRKAHELLQYPSPTNDERVRTVVRGILRGKGEAQKHAKPTLLNEIQQMLTFMPDSLKGVRDKALLLLGFAAGLRRSEIVSLNIEDLNISDKGIILRLRRSKTDQTGKGRSIAVTFGKNKETCPVLALQDWFSKSNIVKGALFRPINKWGQISEARLTDQSVRLIIKESLLRAGISAENFSGHSLRAGFATVAALNGASEREIQKTTGHVSLEVLRRYIRDADIFNENASRKLGL